MNPNNSGEEYIEEIDAESMNSIDEFIRQLEEKEKDLHITETDSVVEISDADESKTAARNGHFKADAGAPAQKDELPDYVIRKFETETNDLRESLRKFEKERDELRELLTRRQSDFENYRKRNEREKGETYRTLVGGVVNQILPVVDNIGRALDLANHVGSEKGRDFREFVNGIVLVNKQLNMVLKNLGVEPIAAVGEPFDPHFHEAVAIEADLNLPPNTVTEEILRGWRLGDKIIRHAMVKVSEHGATAAVPAPAIFDEEDILE